MEELLIASSGDFKATLCKGPLKNNPDKYFYAVNVYLGNCRLCHYYLSREQAQLFDYYLKHVFEKTE